MNLDVIMNSCARPDVLDVAIKTFKKKIKTQHNLKYILLEDKVEDKNRQLEGKEWIEKNKHLFDEIIYSDVIMGPFKFWQSTVKLASTDFIIKLEDDVDFLVDVEIDDALEVMKNNRDIAEIIFRRNAMHEQNLGACVKIDGVKIQEYKKYSIASGLFNTELLNRVLDKAGWDCETHETGVMLPAARKLHLRRYVLGHDTVHYIHVGKRKGYKKGSYK